jgi:hypothetical protein
MQAVCTLISDAILLVSNIRLQAFLLIFFSELGDRTFFIAVSISRLFCHDQGLYLCYAYLHYCMFDSANYMVFQVWGV